MKLDLKNRWENQYTCTSNSSLSYQAGRKSVFQNDIPFDIVIEFIETNAYNIRYLCV